MAAREKLWVVRPGDGATVGEILSRAGEDPAGAVREGRVFVGRRRITTAEAPVRVGDGVRIGAAPAHSQPAPPPVEILFQKEGLLACIKPALIPTVPDRTGASHSLVALVARTIGITPEELRVTSRLDRNVSGVVIFALDARSEARLRTARAEGRYQRRYVAIASGGVPEHGVWDAPIGRGANPRLRAALGPDAKEAETRFRRVAIAGMATMLAVDPVTGRTHQIRVHASHAGAPLLGDRDYGGPTRLTLPDGRTLAPSRIALHAARVVVPGLREALEARAPIPVELEQLWSALGGSPSAWGLALEA